MEFRYKPWLHRFSILTALATLALIGIGGLVTSHGAGMAVPDWPTTYGYNMFLFPISKWVGGIFYEHSHRLVASTVGFLTIILTVWLWIAEKRRWLCWLGTAALVAVILQGVLGGLRVIQFKQELGIFHATLAQMYFVMVCAIALFTSRRWQSLETNQLWAEASSRSLPLVATATVLILAQLALGASMRHQHAGLAIPDFPLAYGKLWPATDAASLARINQQRVDVRDFAAITPAQIYMHMAHRMVAVIILCAVARVFVTIRNQKERLPLVIHKTAAGWMLLILTQVALGIITVLSNKAADMATAHVLVGALSLLTGSLTWILLSRLAYQSAEAEVRIPAREHAQLAAM